MLFQILGDLAYNSTIALVTGHREETISRVLNKLRREGKVTRKNSKYTKSILMLQNGVLASYGIDKKELSHLVH